MSGDFNAEERQRWGGPSPWAGRDSRTNAQKQEDTEYEQAVRDQALDALSSGPLAWEWQRLLQLAVNAAGTADAAQNESDSLVIKRASEWLRVWGIA